MILNVMRLLCQNKLFLKNWLKNFFKYIFYRKTFKKIFSISCYMNSLTDEEWKEMKEIYSDNCDPDIQYFWNGKEIKNYICLEDQFNYCIRKNITF